MNALNAETHAQLRAALARIRSDSTVRAVTLTGTARAFSAGQDLGERAAVFGEGKRPDLRASLEENYNPLIRLIAELPVPVIAAVNGIAFGAGAGIAIACDIVLACSSARFQFGFVNVGLGPDSGTSWSLVRSIGQPRAMDLILSSRPVSAEEALAMGLVSRVVPDGELQETAHAIAGEIAGRSPAAVAAIKRQMRDNPIGSLDDALDAERDAQALLGQTDEYSAAVLRFANTRK